MTLRKDGSGRRWVEMDYLVPGTPEEVWRAMATGPGMSTWFTPTSIDERVGGAIEFDFGSDTSTGTVTGWEPPHRFTYEEHDWSGEAPPLATEVTITSRSGDKCVVRMIHSLFTSRDDWDDEMENFENGWPGFFAVLRVYLESFAGQPAAAFGVSMNSSAELGSVWARLGEALGAAGANYGDRCESHSGTPRFAGVVERVHQAASHREMMIRLEEPTSGVAVLGSCPMGDQSHAAVSIFLYGADAAELAASEQPRWTAWMDEFSRE